MSNPHESPDLKPLPPDSPNRWLWWLHPKVALPLLLFGLLLLSPFLYRGYRISRVPEIGDPFDVDAFGTVDLEPADNAMTHYVVADRLRVSSSAPDDELETALELGWSHTSTAVKKWLDDNQPALKEWRKGTELAQVVAEQPKVLRIDSTLDVLNYARNFTRLSRLQAEHSLHDGDIAEAWNWLHASHRASRHVQMNGCLIQRLVGISMFKTTAQGIQRWAADPRVTANQLREALDDYADADRLTPPLSVAMKAEYCMLKNTLADADGLLVLSDDQLGRPYDSMRRSVLYLNGEPELSRRLFQHVFANLLTDIDKPLREQLPVVPGANSLYDLPSGVTGSLPARELERLLASTNLAQMALPAYSQVGIAAQNEAAQRAAVSLMLACQLYHRLHGDWPVVLVDLVPDILPQLPADPFGLTGETLRIKRTRRHGEQLMIYSIGQNRLDDGGKLPQDPSNGPYDEGIQFRSPTKIENTTTDEPAPQEKK